MRVKELIELLTAMPQHWEVVSFDDERDAYYPVAAPVKTTAVPYWDTEAPTWDAPYRYEAPSPFNKSDGEPVDVVEI